MARFTFSMACCFEIGSSNCTCKSAPVWADVVLSSTRVPVYPWTAATVTMESVRRRMIARRFTDSLDPDPLNPLLISVSAGVQPNNVVKILGPAAPILPRTNAPPIHRKNGPNRNRRPSTMKLELIPPEPHGPNPPLLSIQLSAKDRIPIKKTKR